jgi:CheY-like chemotaxis protein
VQVFDDVEILLVEDDPNDAELALRAFRKHHLANHIVHVKDGAEALAFLFATGSFAGRDMNRHPKVMLLDLKLPKIDGLEVLRKIKGDPRTQMIPVVVMTSSKQDEDVVNSYKFGVNSYIVKPVEFDKFQDVVKQLGLYWLLVNRIPGSL